MESRWTPKTSETNLRGHISIACGVFYIVGKLLECRCLTELALLIWTSETQVMAKRKAESQIASLTPDQKKSGIDSKYLATDDVPHTVGKLSTRATTLLSTALRSKVYSQSYGASKSRESQGEISGLPRESPGREKSFRCGPCGEAHSIL
jgi:hypothetical protein